MSDPSTRGDSGEGLSIGAGCLDDQWVADLLEGCLSEEAQARAEAHLDGCEGCRRVVGAAVRGARGERGAPSTEREPPEPPAGYVAGTLGRGASVGRYLVLSLLGKGAMGRVYAAYDPKLDRRVAVKLLHGAAGSDGARRLLAREARALGKLSHPNVVQVHDVGEHEGDVFVAMELVEGQSLDGYCRSRPGPGYREVLRAYLEAARGLSAAHAKGLVHRDVKPSNVLIGTDGRVRVADFGLATVHEGERPERPTPSGGDDDERLTATGAVLGTPRYMAPEQHEGSRATAASDQYGLCVALYEGLYGATPFARSEDATRGRAFAELHAGKEAGPPPSPPGGSNVPVWIHKALARGLAPDPGARYPSMDALIAALNDDPEARRRSRWRWVAMGAAALGLLAAWLWAKGGAPPDPCAQPDRELAGAWDGEVKARTHAAFLGSGRSYAEDTFGRVVGLLDRYAAGWSAMRGEVCRASRSDARRQELLGLRDACLDRRRGQLQALTTLFAEAADPRVVDRAVAAATDLYPLAYCADAAALTARVRPPEDPAVRARVTAIQPRVDRLDALYGAGKYKDGLGLGESLLSEAREIGYAPVTASVQYRLGQLRERSGDYEGAKALLQDASASAAAGGDDVLVVNAWARLLFVVGEQQRRFEEASVIRGLGRTVLARLADDRARANWLNAEALVLDLTGRHAEAKATSERAVALLEKILGPDHPDVMAGLNNLGRILADMGDYRAARAALERLVAGRERAQGPDHPDVSHGLYNLACVLSSMGEHAAALALYERALALQERLFGPDHPAVGSTLTNMSALLHEMGDDERARELGARSLAIKEKTLGPDHMNTANALTAVARAEVRLGRLDEALPRLERALEALKKAVGPASSELATPLLGLGELYLARRRPEQAAPFLEGALALEKSEETPSVQLTLAEGLWQIGKDRKRARALAEEALAAWKTIDHRPGLERATRWLADHRS